MNPLHNALLSTSFAAWSISIADENSARAKSNDWRLGKLVPCLILLILGDWILLNMGKNVLSKVGALTAVILFLSTELQAFETCFSFIPYANNSSYIQLPKNEKFCFYFSNEKTHMSTDNLGGRIMNREFLPNEIIAFGESQLLGLDQSDLRPQTQHDLSALFPSSAITIYAAPNNGPLQALHQIKVVSPK